MATSRKKKSAIDGERISWDKPKTEKGKPDTVTVYAKGGKYPKIVFCERLGTAKVMFQVFGSGIEACMMEFSHSGGTFEEFMEGVKEEVSVKAKGIRDKTAAMLQECIEKEKKDKRMKGPSLPMLLFPINIMDDDDIAVPECVKFGKDGMMEIAFRDIRPLPSRDNGIEFLDTPPKSPDAAVLETSYRQGKGFSVSLVSRALGDDLFGELAHGEGKTYKEALMKLRDNAEKAGLAIIRYEGLLPYSEADEYRPTKEEMEADPETYGWMDPDADGWIPKMDPENGESSR